MLLYSKGLLELTSATKPVFLTSSFLSASLAQSYSPRQGVSYVLDQNVRFTTGLLVYFTAKLCFIWEALFLSLFFF